MSCTSHNHLEDCLQQNGIFADVSKKEWEPYAAYVKAIDQILKKKGLRYGKISRINQACVLTLFNRCYQENK